MPFTGTHTVSKTALPRALPPEWFLDLSDSLRQRIQQANRKLIVFDDDPTGAQALHSAYVLTRWTPADLIPVLTDSNPLFFIVSNTRTMSREEAIRTNREIATAVANAANTCGIDFDILIRGDSTLRGHFPHERNAIQDVLQSHHHTFDGTILYPFFLEGGVSPLSTFNGWPQVTLSFSLAKLSIHRIARSVTLPQIYVIGWQKKPAGKSKPVTFYRFPSMSFVVKAQMVCNAFCLRQKMGVCLLSMQLPTAIYRWLYRDCSMLRIMGSGFSFEQRHPF